MVQREAVAAVVVVVGMLAGCGRESVHVENFDADHALRSFKHGAGIDHEWVNPRMGHVVSLTSSSAPQCSGTLVGPDLVLTAAHCLVDTYVDGVNCFEGMPPEARFRVVFDRQLVQDSDVGAPAAPVQRDSLLGTLPVAATSIAAVPPGALVSRVDPSSGRRRCTVPDTRLDVAVLRLETPVVDRGFARVRAGTAATGQLLPIIHSPGGAGNHLVAFGSVLSAPLSPDNIHVRQAPLPTSAEGRLRPGSSGSPLFDDEGYIVGVYSNAGCPESADCHEFVAMRFVLPLLPELRNAPQIARSGLGLFGSPPLGGYQLTRTDSGPRNEQPLAVVRFDDGSSVTGGFVTTAAGERAFALVGFDSGGFVDATFGALGVVEDDEPSSTREEIVDLAVQTFTVQPMLVAAASVSVAMMPEQIAVVQYDRSGARDGAFGVGGFLTVDTGGLAASASAVAIDPADGSIVVAGHAAFPTLGRTYETPVVARFAPDGTPVASCGASGVFVWRPEVTTTTNPFITGPVDSYDMVVTDMAIGSDGGIVLVGYLHQLNFHARAPWMARLTSTCAPDPDFGDNGTSVRVFSPGEFLPGEVDNAWLAAVVVEGTRAYAAGTAAAFSPGRGLFGGRMFVLATLRDGSLDTTFAPPLGGGTGSGAALIPPIGWNEVAHGLARGPGPDGDFIVVGESLEDTTGRRRQLRAARLANDGFVTGLTRPLNDVGVLDAWATDVTLRPDGQPLMSVAIREDPDPFDPIPPPGP
ncbi:MAG TPA: hypothetical protein DEF51_33315 [Myxococcales bacterium]|nr:hypothetical protein [Myxococcales bacterium]